jgi:cephalosporin hydroxylase
MANKLLIDLYKNNRGKVSDKWSSYLHHYDRLFLSFKDQELKILEIGIENGGSLEIMGKYFSNAKVLVGCDININCSKLSFEDKRIKLVIGDVNETQIFEKITKIGSPFNIIIDDGSHRIQDQLKSFNLLYPKLKEDGVYVIEDIRDIDSTIKQFKDLENSHKVTVKIFDFRNLKNIKDDVIVEIRK